MLFDLAISKTAQKKIASEINRFKLHNWVSYTIEDIATFLNPKLQGWINYYGRFRKWVFLNSLRWFSFRLMKWAKNKYKFTSVKKAFNWVNNYQKLNPNLFALWRFGFKQ